MHTEVSSQLAGFDPKQGGFFFPFPFEVIEFTLKINTVHCSRLLKNDLNQDGRWIYF